MRRVTQVTMVSRRMMVESDLDPMQIVPYPPYPHWFARGPRGGVYLATGVRTRKLDEKHADAWMRNEVAVVDQSYSADYVRPGTALYREATGQ